MRAERSAEVQQSRPGSWGEMLARSANLGVHQQDESLDKHSERAAIPPSGPAALREAVTRFQRAVGNQGVQRLMRGSAQQRRAATKGGLISEPLRRYLEARSARARFVPGLPTVAGSPVSQPESTAERAATAAADGMQQSSAVGTAGNGAARPSPQVLAGSIGQPLPESLRLDHESRLQVSLADVQVHDDAPAHALTQSIGARAATLGSHIYFANSAFQPRTAEGRRLLAHELVHTTQPESNSVLHRFRDDVADLQQIDRELASMVISDERRAELLSVRAEIAELPHPDVVALAREADRRKEALELGVSVSEEGPSSITVPLSAMVTVPEPLDGPALFSQVAADPSSDRVSEWSVSYVATQYLAGKLDWPVTVEILEPGDGVWFNVSVRGENLVASRNLQLPLEALDALSDEKLATVVARAAQVVQVAILAGGLPLMLVEIGDLPERIIANPEEYARNEARGLWYVVASYADRLTIVSKSLLPGNEWLLSTLTEQSQVLAPHLKRVDDANYAAMDYQVDHPEASLGAGLNARIERSENRVERFGWGFWSVFWDVVTLGGVSSEADNLAMYERGEISHDDFKKNQFYGILRVGFKAVLTALTAGRATGPAMRLLGLEGASFAANVVAFQAEGAVGGSVDAIASDIYASVVATVSSSKGVVAFHKQSVVGFTGWVNAGATGSVVGSGLPFARAAGSKAIGALARTRASRRAIPAEPTTPGGMAEPDATIVSKDLASGDVVVSVRDPVTGEAFSNRTNVHTGDATVTNAATAEVVGYVRNGRVSTPAQRAPSKPIVATPVEDLPAVAPKSPLASAPEAPQLSSQLPAEVIEVPPKPSAGTSEPTPRVSTAEPPTPSAKRGQFGAWMMPPLDEIKAMWRAIARRISPVEAAEAATFGGGPTMAAPSEGQQALGTALRVARGEVAAERLVGRTAGTRAEPVAKRILGRLGSQVESAEANLARLQAAKAPAADIKAATAAVNRAATARFAFAQRAGQLSAEARASFMDSINDVMAKRPNAPDAIADLLTAAAESRRPNVFLQDVLKLVDRGRGISDEALRVLGKKARAGVDKLDLGWLNRTSLSNEAIDFLGRDANTDWNLFRIAATRKLTKAEAKQFYSKMRGASAEMLALPIAEEMGSVRPQVPMGSSVPDYEITIGDKRRGMEVKGFSPKTWGEALEAATRRLNKKKLTSTQKDAVEKIDRMTQQLTDAKTATNQRPILVLTDKLSAESKIKLDRILRDKGLSDTEFVTLIESKIKSEAATLAEAIGAQ
jgi:hypothetical protein